MSLLTWFKDHFEMLAAGFVGIFGFGGVYMQHKNHGKDIKDLKDQHLKYQDDLSEVKGDIKTLLERTKHL